MVPWDAEIFGFPVAVYRTGAEHLDAAAQKEFIERFQFWMRQNRISLCGCTIPAKEPYSVWKYHLGEAGFHVVDFGLQATLNGLQASFLPEARSELRAAVPDDHNAIETIAAESFRSGRYHADPLFRRELADKRYGSWVRNALAARNRVDRVYVMGEPGTIQGFYHITVEGTVADLRLAAVAPALKGTLLGFDLYASALHLLRGLGVQRIVTNISATNTAVMNVYATLGFSFSEPEMIFHWHSGGPGT